MDIYSLAITFRAAPSATFFTRELGLPPGIGREVVAKAGGSSVEVAQAKSPQHARLLAIQLQEAFEAGALPSDMEHRLKRYFTKDQAGK